MASRWQALRSWWDAGPGAAAGRAASRTTGPPRSANGASSFHLRWQLPSTVWLDEVVEVAVTLEVLEAPAVDRLYFWALQVDVADGSGRRGGGAHLGLQHHPQHPGSTAVNWGGYDASGEVLDGSAAALPSATGNPHTRDWPWRAGVPYRLTVARAGPTGDGRTAWRGSVAELLSGRSVGEPGGRVATAPATPTATVVRELWAEGDRVAGVVVWSEVFARCDDPAVAVRWSDPVVRTADGEAFRATSVLLSYQTHADGGCANTDSSADELGVVQRTGCERRHPPGARLEVPDPGRARS